MLWLKQSTASQEALIGPFLDDTDGKTAETGLTIANTDIKIWKAGATTEADKNSGGGTHVAGGRYSIVLDATDTNTLGSGEINVHVAGALPVRRPFIVLPANVYDSIVGGSDTLQADVTQWLGQAVATPSQNGVPEVDITHWLGSGVATPTVAGVPEVDATHVAGNQITSHRGTAGTVTSTTTVLDSTVASDEDDVYIGAEITILSATTGAEQTVQITDYVGGTYTATHGAYPAGAPTGTTTYELNPRATSSVSIPSTVDANVVSMENDTITAAAIATGAIDADAIASDAITAAKIAADAIGASELATDAVTEIVTAILAGTVTVSAPSDGSAPTVAQALSLLMGKLGVFKLSRSGTTMTAYANDETTVLATWSLDSATTPTSVTRAS